MDDDITQEVDSDENRLGDISVDWKNIPKLGDLQRDLRDASTSQQEQVRKIKVWRDNLNVRGKAKVKKRKGRSDVVPKLIRKQAEWRYPALSEPFLNSEDIFNVEPATWEDKPAAKQNQLVLNHQFNNEIDKVGFIDEFVRTAVNEGTVIYRVGWEFKEEEVTEKVPQYNLVLDPKIQGIIDEIAVLKVENPNHFEAKVPFELQAALIAFEKNGKYWRPILNGKTRTFTKKKTVINRPTVEICNTDNVTIDPTCGGDVNKANFWARTYESSKAELRMDGKFKNLNKIKVSTDSTSGHPEHNSEAEDESFTFRDDARAKFIVTEMWANLDVDNTGTTRPVTISWVGDVVIHMGDNPFPDKKAPFGIVSYLPVLKSVYGEPDGELLEDNQKIVGAVTRGMIDLMGRSSNSQVGIAKGFLDSANRSKRERGLDFEFNPTHTPDAAVHMAKFPEIPQSASLMINSQYADAESSTGVKAFSQGITGETYGAVAGAARTAVDAAGKRELGILRRLSAAIVDIGRKFMSMNGEFLSETEVIRITNEVFEVIRRDELQGQFDLKLSISTVEADQAKAQGLEYTLQTIGNNMDPELRQIIQAEIATLNKMPHLAKRMEEFKPTPDPVQQQIQQLEIQKLQADIALIQSQTQENLAEAGLDKAKVGTEIAKAGQINALTDQASLDFVEQETGVKQERDLEKQGEQARGNMQLELVKSGLKKEEEAVKSRLASYKPTTQTK